MYKFASNFCYFRNVAKYVEKLTPLFKLDALLPRSIIACFCFDAIPHLAVTKLFPPDVLAANLYFFLLFENNINYNLEVS